MRKFRNTLLLIALLLSPAIEAQLKEHADSIIKINSEGIQVARSYFKYDDNMRQTMSMHYTYNKKTNKWVGTFRETTAYDNMGNCLNKTTSYWDMPNCKWMEMTREISEYDLNGRKTEYDVRQWNRERVRWIGQEKYSCTFNDKGLLLSMQEYFWNDSFSDWVRSTRSEYEYNEQGQKTIETYSTWSEAWQKETQTRYTYNEKSTLLSEIQYTYENGQWIPNTETSYTTTPATTDENGTRTKHIRLYDRTTQKWTDLEQYVSSINVQGSEVSMKRREYKNNQWYVTKNERNTLEYDSNGNEIFNEKSLWVGGNDWTGRLRTEIQYNEYGDIAMERETTWDINTNNWKGSKYIEYEYDKDGYVTKEIHHRWDTKSNSWRNFTTMVFEYDENHNKIKESTSSWNNVKQRWDIFYNGKFEYTFDKEGYITSITEWMIDPNGKWKKVSTTYYH